VLRILDVFPGSRVKKIPDPGSVSTSKILSIFNSWKYEPGFSSWIRIPDSFFYTFVRNSGEQILQELIIEVDDEGLVITSPDEDEEDSASNRFRFSN
jgi:hypothetical protein